MVFIFDQVNFLSLVCHSAVKCGVCGFVCHKKCAAFTANICGVDQKSIARALQAIDTDKQVQGILTLWWCLFFCGGRGEGDPLKFE